MGRKLERIEVSRLFFFKIGWTTACFRTAGTQPERREELIIESTLGPVASKTSLNSRDGIQSVLQFVGLRCMTTSVSVVRDTGSKWVRVAEGGGRMGEGTGSRAVEE